MSIIGEKFKPYVQAQIAKRQVTHGKGLLNGSTRSVQEIQLLNNQNAWLKLSSSVRVIGNAVATPTTGSAGEVPASAGVDRLKAIGLTQTDNFLGNKLAKQAVLFNTLSEVVSSTYNDKGNLVKNKDGSTTGTHKSRFGVTKSNSVWNMNSYGLGGTNFGLSPAINVDNSETNALLKQLIKKTPEMAPLGLYEVQ